MQNRHFHICAFLISWLVLPGCYHRNDAVSGTIEVARMRVTQARAQLAEIDAQLQEMQVTAPGDSVLEVLDVKVGDVLPANREVATLILPQHLWVRVYVPEPWLGHIKLGDAVRVRVDSFQGKDFPGTVEQINRQAEFTPRNVQTVADRIQQVFGVKIRLPNNDERLRAGMSAVVYFPNVKCAELPRMNTKYTKFS